MTKLGQHFLKDKDKIQKIVDALEIKEGDVVVEIGPGHGALTLPLLETCSMKHATCLIVIEKDKQLAEELKFKANKHKAGDKLEIIVGDALKELPKISFRPQISSYKLVGNIPYYLTGYLFRIIGELKTKPPLIVFTIQKEVAERVAAQPPKMNLLAASVQYWAEPQIIGKIPAGAFRPVPKVDSAIIKLKAIEHETRNMEQYYKFIKILFKQPRKTIINNLSGLKNKDELLVILKKLDIKEAARPQDLSIEKIKKLTRTALFN